MSNAIRRFVMAAAFGFLAPATMHASTLALDFTSGVDGNFTKNATIGWSFTTNQAITVTALDAWALGNLPSYNVRLYDGAGDILASAVVSSSDPTEGAGFGTFYSHAIAPVALLANTTYYIAEDAPFNDSEVTLFADSVVGLAPNPSISYGGGVSANGLAGLPAADNLNGGALDPSYFGPNFDIATAAPSTVPEPSSMILLGLGVGSVWLYAGMRRRRGAVAAAV